MKTALQVVLCITVQLLCITRGHYLPSCQCVGDQHPQVKFNDAEWVIKGRIIQIDHFPCHGTSYGFPTNSDQNEDDLRYVVVVEEVFKGEISTTCKLTIVTAASADRCGVPDLIKGETYLLSGKIQDGEKVIDNCDWIVLWSEVTSHQKNSISESRRYADNEMCQSKCPYRQPDKLCCYYKYATCVEKIKQVEVTSSYQSGYGQYVPVYETKKVCNWVVGFRFEPCLNPPTTTIPPASTTQSGGWYM